MRARPLLPALVTAACLAAPPSTWAQKTYRCGNTYQSHPCALSDGKAGGPTPRSGELPGDQEQRERCARIGQAQAQNNARLERATNANEREALLTHRAEIDREARRSCN
jgi:hypothetical protein